MYLILYVSYVVRLAALLRRKNSARERLQTYRALGETGKLKGVYKSAQVSHLIGIGPEDRAGA